MGDPSPPTTNTSLTLSALKPHLTRTFRSPRKLTAILVALMLTVTWMSIMPSTTVAAGVTGPDRVYFPQTGQYLSYGFLNYWRSNGGIQIFGYPISEELKDPSTGLTVQYFERAVFEWHGDQPQGSQVMLRRLGATVAQGLSSVAAFKPITAVSNDTCNFYAETGHRLCNGFLDYWQSNGGLATFGFPLSEEFTQNGFTVQYFERARFEWHPGSGDTPSQVMLGLLGSEAAKAAGVSLAAVPQNSSVPTYSAGLWYDPNAAPEDVTSPPPGAPSGDAKWIEVDLTHQYMRAWEYNKVVYSEYISSGLPPNLTPTGTFHIFEKLPTDDMTNGKAGDADYYYLPDVPWVMYFYQGGYALHGTYWHHNFGHEMSHGCVNMTIPGAEWVYNWAPLGTTVWIHY
ncbi:MAG TPA: L,D-transpeptidase [Nitrolancea sp.]|jgi:hypothetical protein|nr:L,D-transpeptidase [Nitrolancea sp.]